MYQAPSQQLLSFNSTSKDSGKCDNCNGHGIVENIYENALFTNKSLSSIDCVNLKFDEKGGYYKYIFLPHGDVVRECKKANIDITKSYFEITKDAQDFVKEIFFTRMIKHKNKDSISIFWHTEICPICNGTRLNYKANAIKLFDKNISEMLNLSVDEALVFLKDKPLHHKKILDILESLKLATLGYLTLNRTLTTLSGGESQRLKLSLILHSKYNDLLYILDEPSSGLHPYNNMQIFSIISQIAKQKNTILISEHNEFYKQHSDLFIELGKGSGINGGEIIHCGKYNKKDNSLNIKYRESKDIDLKQAISLKNVTCNNIKDEDFIFPLNCLIAVSGVSGSGKSSLLKGVLLPLCEQYIQIKTINTDLAQKVENLDSINNIAYLGQEQIHSNSRSIVATYLGIFDRIRDLYASLDKSLDSGYFSFNSKVGQCESCAGSGSVDENICPICMGSGYKNIVLSIKYNNLNILEFLETELSIIKKIFNDSKLSLVIDTLDRLGLSYLSFGRRVDSLSGGESQRLRLAKQMLSNEKNIKKGNFIFILDEPSKGLDSISIQKLYNLFDDIISHNNTIIVIEHNLNVIRNADFIIDIGVGAGANGGKNIFSGCWEDFLHCKDSITAQFINGKIESKITNITNNNNLTSRQYNFDVSKYPFNKFLLNDKHFSIEQDFTANYEIESRKNYLYFKSFDELLKYGSQIDKKNFYFNPLIEFLYKFEKVPASIKTKILKKHKNILDSKDDWHCIIPAKSLLEAYQKGLGIVYVLNNNNIESILSTRFISLEQKIIGAPIINPKTFSLYFNRCEYCDGAAKLDVYDKNLIIQDTSKSILDSNFLKFKLNLKLKTIISKFKSEGLFDFTQSFDSLNNKEQNIFLYGFIEYEFLKPNGRINAKGDYIRWEGLYTYIYYHLDFIQNAREIIDSKHKIDCPFCAKGLKKELQFYGYNGKSIVDYY
ncbi:ATP-binding cassette domain-containing protein [Helicobacter saguini]|uniref:UvrABC system protein A n=1 Tax=Helicobacter saguini TaxID=1548018 RepID=A0A099B863_9HELI|nr:ATP-binding cassette domain-containing protein [Helicobacter saguini]MWV63010.1 ATP-binding cassette domain-containing protein [Helicobacter saguini]MWV66321.1 ATP-binding cassette domain-containing protein [Helicobacter saguini]MWV68673.1 ATP-binding cassette domain-containing protein [Helicobacter saguini]MWV71776.1 ATP-binding cassette domain-containing protein [Helicobacter saguini]TLD95805.1 ATP-binding cassette domain-containing protein [Helicobacter saguini]